MKLFMQCLASGLFCLVVLIGVCALASGVWQAGRFIVRRTRRKPHTLSEKLPTAPDVDFEDRPRLRPGDLPLPGKDGGSHGSE